MSNLSTLPKGDSAWLLRKALERIIKQVSVLETNIGASTTGNSANTQVIFNDNGVLRGDPDFIFNAALNKLVALNIESTAALVVGTTASITGDLTVDTNTLKVDSANNRVGIINATPATALDVNGDITQRNGSGVIIGNIQNSAGYYDIKASSNVIGVQLSTAGPTPIRFLPNNTLAATLDSSGNLGLGVTPSAWNSSYKALQIGSIGALSSVTNSTLLSANYYRSASADVYIANGAASIYLQAAGAHQWYNAASGTAGNAITFTQAMTLDASGNLGVGIASPFADTNYKSIDLRGTTGGEVVLGTSGSREVTITGDGTNGLTLNTINSTPLRFFTQGGEKMRLKNTGQLRFVPLAADPAGAEAGDVYYNSTDNKLKCYNGTSWNDLF